MAAPHISLAKLLAAGANALPITILFGGIAALGYALARRQATTIAYALVAVAFLWQLAGSLLSPPWWLLDITPFAHVEPLPEQPFQTVAATVMTSLGAIAALAAIATLHRRDTIGK